MRHALTVPEFAGRRLMVRSYWQLLRPLALLTLLLTGAPAVAQVVVGRAAPTVADRKQVLREVLHLAPTADLRPLETTPDPLGFVHEQYQLYYQGVKVEHGQYRVHSRAGKVEAVSGEARQPAAGLSAQPALTAKQALQHAMTAVGARTYKWQLPAEEAALKVQTGKPAATYQPRGELVWVGDFRQPEARRPLVLAWKFDVYAHEPASRDYLYIHAQTGQVVLRDAIIKHLNSPGASFATRYVGARTSTTDNTGAGYRLRETTTSKGVTTLNLRKSTNFATAVDFIDNDNNWTAAEHDNANFDNAALDAHLGAQVTQEYWTSVHGRDSYDDKGTVLLSYVHYGNGVDNAFWNGTAMLYGDGSSRFKPLTALDVCGHEIGHAVCETTADLVYANESGALNEALSDIWGCAVENHFDPSKQIYLIGEDITLPSFGLALRSMSNPNQFGQPDTYKGTLWFTGTGDNGGVHFNSGVLNFWFYLLSAGGAGTNDFATTYSVTGISIASAARIAYRAERFYMTPSTNYTGARKATMQAAVDLFGLGSNEVIQTAQAWRAVGVGDGTGNSEGAPTITSFAPGSGVPGTVVTLTGTNLGATQSVTFNGVAATFAALTSGTGISVTVPATATTGLISLTTATATTASAGNFVITSAGPAPVISSFAPAGGQAQGGAVAITGTDFTGATALSFNGTAATILTNTGTAITTTVPPGATSGPLTVTTPDGMGTAPGPFTVLPSIASFSPGSGVVGTAVTITGTSFTGALSVKFNGVYAGSFTVVNATTITTTVPVGATTGPVSVRTPSGTATSPTSFTVTPSLSIDSFSPTSGAAGNVVTIRGRGFTGTSAITFGGVNAPTFSVASDLELWATVPVGAVTGVIGLTTPLGPATSPSSFQVLCPTCPTITSFTPTSGPVGTAVTVTGTNFTGATAVSFNGTAAVFSVTNATTIATTVPAGATNGPISVTTPVNTGFSSTSFALPPANDLCANSGLPVLACGATVLGTTLGSTSTGDPTGTCTAAVSAAAGGVFYRFEGTGGSVTLTTCNAATNYDTQLFVYSGTCGALVCVGGNDDLTGTCAANGSTLPSSVTFTSVAGTSYFIFVNGFNGARGSFGLSATCVPAPPVITSLTPGSGPVGTSVTLAGVNFTGATGVAFNGTAASFSVVDAYTATATVPASATTGPVSLTTGLGTATSAASFLVPPTVAITSTAGSSGGNTSTSPIPMTVTFSQPVTGFAVGGVSVGNGTAGSFSGSGSSYTFDVTPAGDGLVTVDVPANAAQTSTGDGNLAAPQFSITYTQPVTPAPVVTVPANGNQLNTATPSYSGTAVAGSTVTVYVDGSSIGTTTAPGGSWTKTQPAALSQGAHTVKATAQLSGQAGSADSNTNNFTVDTVAPTVALASTAPPTTTSSPIPVTVLFSEAVTGFVAADVSVSNGAVSGFSGSGQSYSFNVTPAAPGTVTVNVAANVAQDAAGNGNPAAPALSRTYSVPPAPASVRVLYLNADCNQPGNGTVTPALQVVNNGPVAIPYAQLTLRYWLTVENFAPVLTSIYWAQLGTNRVLATYVPLATPRQGAFGYVEYSFLPAAGTLAPGANSGIILSAIYKNNWTDFNETDDYSYAPNRTYLPTTRITAYRSGVLIAGLEPAAVPGVISLAAYAANRVNSVNTSSLAGTAQLGNLGNLPVPYSDLKVRYWFSPDGTSPLVGTIDYAALNRANVTVHFGQQGTQTYAELRFAASLGVLAPLSNTGDILFRLNKANWSNFNQANDYSYRPKAPLALHPRMTVYRQGLLVYGTEPAGALARPGLASGSEPAATALLLSYPSPFSAIVHLDFALPRTGPYTLAVYDGLGRLVETLATGTAPAGELRRADWVATGHATGLYLLRLTSDSGVQQLRLQKE